LRDPLHGQKLLRSAARGPRVVKIQRAPQLARGFAAFDAPARLLLVTDFLDGIDAVLVLRIQFDGFLVILYG
jgi:hypothetical protein